MGGFLQKWMRTISAFTEVVANSFSDAQGDLSQYYGALLIDTCSAAVIGFNKDLRPYHGDCHLLLNCQN